MADEFVTYSAKLNFKNAGARLGAKAKGAAKMVAALDSDSIKDLKNSGKIELELDGDDKVTLTSEEVEVIQSDVDGWAVASEGNIASILPTVFNEDLKFEGYVRDWINQIQKFRKESGLEVTDRINLKWYTDNPALKNATGERAVDIAGPTLTNNMVSDDQTPSLENSKQVEIMGIGAHLWIEKDTSDK